MAFKSVRGLDERGDDARLGGGVAGVWDDSQVRFGPGAVQVPRASHGADNVVAPLHYDAGDVPNFFHVLDEIVVCREEGVVHEVVTLDARKRQGELRLGELLDHRVVEEELRSAPLPDAPRARSFEPDTLIAARQPTVVGAHKVSALLCGNRLLELLPHVRENPTRALLVEPP